MGKSSNLTFSTLQSSENKLHTKLKKRHTLSIISVNTFVQNTVHFWTKRYTLFTRHLYPKNTFIRMFKQSSIWQHFALPLVGIKLAATPVPSSRTHRPRHPALDSESHKKPTPTTGCILTGWDLTLILLFHRASIPPG